MDERLHQIAEMRQEVGESNRDRKRELDKQISLSIVDGVLQ